MYVNFSLSGPLISAMLIYLMWSLLLAQALTSVGCCWGRGWGELLIPVHQYTGGPLCLPYQPPIVPAACERPTSVDRRGYGFGYFN